MKAYTQEMQQLSIEMSDKTRYTRNATISKDAV
jgi:hypothetical protein